MIQKRLFPGTVTVGLLLCLGVTPRITCGPGAPAQLAQQQATAAPSPPIALYAPIEEQEKVTAYTLPPDLYRKAKALGRIHFLKNLVNFVYGLFVFWLILIGASLRNSATGRKASLQIASCRLPCLPRP